MKKTAVITAIIIALIAGPENGLTAATQEHNEAISITQPPVAKQELRTVSKPAPAERCTGFFYACRRQSVQPSGHRLAGVRDDMILNLR